MSVGGGLGRMVGKDLGGGVSDCGWRIGQYGWP